MKKDWYYDKYNLSIVICDRYSLSANQIMKYRKCLIVILMTSTWPLKLKLFDWPVNVLSIFSCYGVRVFLFSSIYVLWLPLWRIQAFLNQGNKFSGINTSAWWLLTYICIHYSMLALNISKKKGGIGGLLNCIYMNILHSFKCYLVFYMKIWI
jgi:hypothetical protein